MCICIIWRVSLKFILCLFSKGLEVDIHAAIYLCVLFLTQSCDKELESINDKRNIASRCLRNIISIISEVKCKLLTIKGWIDLEKCRDFLMFVYNALNKYHSIVTDDSEFVHNSHKTKHKYDIKYDKFLQVKALYLCFSIELMMI